MKKLYLIFAVCFTLGGFSPLVSHAASDGCSDEKNDFINQHLALCSTHAYNIGSDKNPTSADDKQLMNDVIALKATIMTQQMKKQYDFLDVTVKRFKTQLEKAILTAQMQAAGAPSEDSGSAGGKSSTNFENCSVGSRAEMISCLRRNNTKYAAAATDRKLDVATRKQMERDASILDAQLANTGDNMIATNCNANKMSNSRNDPGADNCVMRISGGINLLEDKERSANRQIK